MHRGMVKIESTSFALHLSYFSRIPRRSIFFFINLRVTRRKFEIKLIIKAIEEASEWNLLNLRPAAKRLETKQPTTK
jgi:hypothetical protein